MLRYVEQKLSRFLFLSRLSSQSFFINCPLILSISETDFQLRAIFLLKTFSSTSHKSLENREQLFSFSEDRLSASDKNIIIDFSLSHHFHCIIAAIILAPVGASVLAEVTL
ncbi:TPA: hypothetical protein DEG21_03640 [Patescibacteria group bacterium]|nr:hypothetical protein [Candidatus Gracilibacteria bacterium]HBY74946.1 hypothetical protein [Candidatus Gracilibacteria bacterium]